MSRRHTHSSYMEIQTTVVGLIGSLQRCISSGIFPPVTCRCWIIQSVYILELRNIYAILTNVFPSVVFPKWPQPRACVRIFEQIDNLLVWLGRMLEPTRPHCFILIALNSVKPRANNDIARYFIWVWQSNLHIGGYAASSQSRR